MTSTPVVTTLLPTHVLTPWLDDSVASALAQDHPEHEVLVVHDGIDVDRSRPWVSDSRVTCVTTGTSHGLAHALTVGARAASGDLLSRLDGDDLSEPTRLSRQVSSLAAATDAVLLGTLAHRIDEEGRTTGLLGHEADGDVRPDLLTRNVVIHSSVLLPRAAYEEVGGYDARLRQMEDYHLWLRLAALGEVRVLQERLVRYRVHSGQMNRGAGASGAYIGHVLDARIGLARALSRSVLAQRGRNELWRAAQLARHRGWRRPGYAR